MDLQKTAGDTVDGIVSTIKFLGVYSRNSLLLGVPPFQICSGFQ